MNLFLGQIGRIREIVGRFQEWKPATRSERSTALGCSTNQASNAQ